MLKTKILKFGGTSMGSVDSLKNIACIIQKNQSEGIQPIIVCSAMSQITNNLIAMEEIAIAGQKKEALELFQKIEDRHLEVARLFDIETKFATKTQKIFVDLKNFITKILIIRKLSDKRLAYLSAYGEKLSVRLLSCILESLGIEATPVDSTFIKNKNVDWLEDEVDWIATKNQGKSVLNKVLKTKKIPIITGFFGTNNNNDITLLGRGGSDYSAAIISMILNCKTVEIWTDVDGFMSADPKLVPAAKVLPEIGFREASELCFFGAKILHPRTIYPIINMTGGEVWIKNTFNTQAPGTRITKHAPPTDKIVISLSSKKIAMLSLDFFGSSGQKHRAEIFYEIFKLIKDYKISIDAIASSETMVSFCIKEKYLKNKNFIKNLKAVAPLDISQDLAILCIVSPENAVYNNYGILAQIFGAIAEAKVSVKMDSENASEVGQLVVIKNKDLPKTIKTIHAKLIE